MKTEKPTATAKVVFELSVVRENGDADVVFLCLACQGTTRDFLRITRKRRCGSSVCDRCG